ncbi:hypothetical protein Ahy_B04g071941 [Arachis hypogaea]|uniref:PB1-like domain-containing protein n=1 Tax=Arachis hypogaea TaxID=3818 RepID=A0A444ZM06_ARAHY|nr:hypothetical protein Ahy_B04g071941 [Arachis hypogaea]
MCQGGEKTVIEDVDMDCWSVFEAYAEVGQFGYTKEKISAFWYKDLSSEWLEKDLKLFKGDRDAIEMCKIAGKRGHIELYVVHKVEDAEEFPEVGFLDVGGPRNRGEQGQEVERDNADKVNEGDKLNPEEHVKSNSDDDSDDWDFIPSDGEVDSADDVMFTDSEEEYDDESGFDEVRGETDGDRVDKGKGVAGGDFSDEEGFNSDEVDVDYELSGIPCTHAISCINFKGLDIDAFVDDCYKKPAYVKCYDSVINPLNGPDLWEKTNFNDVMPPPYQEPSHRPVKKRKRGPDEAPDNSQSHLSRRGQIQRCSNCGEFGHKRGGCKKPSLDAQQPRQAASKRTRGGRKPSSSRPITSSKTSSQPDMQSASGATTSSQPNSTHSRSKPTSSSTRPNSPPAGTLHRRPKRKPTRSLTQQPPAPKEKGAASSSQPARAVSFSHRISLHVSPRKLRLMAKLLPRLWGKL